MAEASIWVGLDVYFQSGLPPTNADVSYFVTCDDGVVAGADAANVMRSAGNHFWSTFFATDSPYDEMELDVWYHVDFYCETGARATELWVGGVDQQVTPTGTQDNDVTAVSFGSFGEGWETDHEVYVTNLTLGTTRGGSELWESDLSEGIGAFDDTEIGSGETLDVVDDPTGTAPGGATKVLRSISVNGLAAYATKNLTEGMGSVTPPPVSCASATPSSVTCADNTPSAPSDASASPGSVSCASVTAATASTASATPSAVTCD